MKTLIKIGTRNVRRNLRRTLITALAIFVGVVVILLTRGLLNGIQANIKSSVTDTQLSDMQVHAKGYVDSMEGAPLTPSLPQDFVTQKMVLDAGGAAVSPRIMFGGLISYGDNSTMLMAQAIDPATEFDVTPRKKLILAQGRHLAPGDTDTIVLANGLAAGMHVKVGDTVTVLTNTLSGAMNAADLTVVGTVTPGSPLENKRLAFVTLQGAQQLLGMKDRVTEFAIHMPARASYEQTEDTVRRLSAELAKQPVASETHTWKQLMPTMVDLLKTQDIVLGIVVAVLFFIVLVGIINTMLMSVFERVREVGTMMAIGMRRPQVIIMFLFEALTLGIIGASAGAVAGLALIQVLDTVGIMMPVPGSDITMPLEISVASYYPLLAMAVAVASALLAAVYPAWQASKLKPIDAIRSR